MKNIFTLLGFNFLTIVMVFAQQDVREQVYVHLNSQTFVSGETMHFAAYCNSQLTGEPSALSKVLYVEIVGKDGPVHQQKIDLNEGRGNSRFFFSSNIPSGQYYLIAYTRWMKNFDDYFQAPILIVNPYETYTNAPTPAGYEFQLFPVHDPLVAGVENTVGYCLKTVVPSNYKGRIVDNDGEVISNFGIGPFGLGKLKFTAKAGKTYQVILEDDLGNISFHRLPAVESKGSFVVYEESKHHLSFKLQASDQVSDSLYLTLSDGNVLYNTQVSPHAFHAIPKEVLSRAGIYKVHYSTAEGDKIAQRSIFISVEMPTTEQLAKAYGTREQITLVPKLDDGNYSISVRRKLDQKLDGHQHAVWNPVLQKVLVPPVAPSQYLIANTNTVDMEAFMLSSATIPVTVTPEQVSLLPEVREEILVGQIKDGEGNPAAGEKVALTFPGKDFQLRFSESNAQGDFLIPFGSKDADMEAIVTAIDFNKQFDIQIKTPFLEYYPEFQYPLPFLDSGQVKKIIERSVRVQLENAYFELLTESPKPGNTSKDIPYHEVYRLDDYRRFQTLQETFTEFIVTANIRRNRDYVIKTTYSPGLGQAGYPPLVLLDGMPISGDRVTKLSPYRVESISTLPNRYFLGPVVVDGIVGIETFDQDYGDFPLTVSTNHKSVPILGVSRKGSYRFPDYAQKTDRYIADQRDQLYWEPAFRPGENSAISFYTSDVPGEYEIVIEGFTNDGGSVSKVYTFWVR